MTRQELEDLGADLLLADEAADVRRVAAIAWQLYGEAGTALAEVERLHGMLKSGNQPTRCLPIGPRIRIGK